MRNSQNIHRAGKFKQITNKKSLAILWSQGNGGDVRGKVARRNSGTGSLRRCSRGSRRNRWLGLARGSAEVHAVVVPAR